VGGDDDVGGGGGAPSRWGGGWGQDGDRQFLAVRHKAARVIRVASQLAAIRQHSKSLAPEKGGGGEWGICMYVHKYNLNNLVLLKCQSVEEKTNFCVISDNKDLFIVHCSKQGRKKFNTQSYNREQSSSC
jgi:hypothetical protein